MNFNSDRFIDVAFDDHDFEKLLRPLTLGDTVSAGALLTALDAESEDVLQEAFDHLDDMGVALDLSDLPRSHGDGEAAARLRMEEQLAASGDLLSSLEDADPLRLYLEEIAGIPVCGDMDVLALELAEANRDQREDPQLWTRILNLSLSRVVEIAREYTGYGVLLMDLIQDGSMALWQRIPDYCGGSIKNFLDHCIRSALSKTVVLQAHASGVGQRMRRAMEDYRSVDEKLLMELGRNPTLEEIADAMHISLAEAAQVADMMEKARTLNRAKTEAEPEEETPEAEQAVENTAYFQMRQRIQELLSCVTEQEAKLLTLRFGLEGGLPLNPEEAGRKLGMTAAEVLQMEAAALSKLRKE